MEVGTIGDCPCGHRPKVNQHEIQGYRDTTPAKLHFFKTLRWQQTQPSETTLSQNITEAADTAQRNYTFPKHYGGSRHSPAKLHFPKTLRRQQTQPSETTLSQNLTGAAYTTPAKLYIPLTIRRQGTRPQNFTGPWMTARLGHYSVLAKVNTKSKKRRIFNNVPSTRKDQDLCFLHISAAIACMLYKSVISLLPHINATVTRFPYNLKCSTQ